MIPDFMPTLRRGAGLSPRDGGCLVQVASWLHDGQSWSDSTPCVHPALRSVAIAVNDLVSDEVRQRLLPLAPRLVGTGLTGDERYDREVSVRLAVWAARQALPLVRPEDRAVCERAVEAAEAWADNPCEETGAAAAVYAAAYAADADALATYAAGAVAVAAAYAADAAAAADDAAAVAAYVAGGVAADAAAYAADAADYADDPVAFLVGLVGEYDRITGRETSGATVTEQQWRALAEVMADQAHE